MRRARLVETMEAAHAPPKSRSEAVSDPTSTPDRSEARGGETGSDPPAHADAVAKDERAKTGVSGTKSARDEAGARDRRFGEPKGLQRVTGREEDAEQEPDATPRR